MRLNAGYEVLGADNGVGFATPLATGHKFQGWADKFLTTPGDGIEDVYIGWRPLPLDGHPVIGASPAVPSAYIAIAHSGVTLAPIIGKLAAQELLTGRASERLADYRPIRSFEEVRRY